RLDEMPPSCISPPAPTPMYSALPLDDRLGKVFYIDGAPWRVIYNRTLQRVALRRLSVSIPLTRALRLIATGEMLWTPPEPFAPFDADETIDSVQQHLS